MSTEQRRAVVWKTRGGVWWAESCERWHWHPGAGIQWRTLGRTYHGQPFATHAAALAHALEAVGLAPTHDHLEPTEAP